MDRNPEIFYDRRIGNLARPGSILVGLRRKGAAQSLTRSDTPRQKFKRRGGQRTGGEAGRRTGRIDRAAPILGDSAPGRLRFNSLLIRPAICQPRGREKVPWSQDTADAGAAPLVRRAGLDPKAGPLGGQRFLLHSRYQNFRSHWRQVQPRSKVASGNE